MNEEVPTDDLPAFQMQATCPKCGSQNINARWHQGGTECVQHVACGQGFGDYVFGHNDEHMHRRCTFCGYDWVEAPIS